MRLLILFALIATAAVAGSIAPQPVVPPASVVGADSLTGSATTKTVTLPRAMPDATYAVIVMSVDADQGAKSWSSGNLATGSFNVTVSSNTGTLNFTYQVVDY